jgi:hypothetical protein
MFINVTASQLDKPNRVKDEKDEEYHVKYGKYAVATSATNINTDFIRKVMVNKAFYKGQDNQWQFDEDIEAFLKDDTGQSRNRIKVVHNIIRPLVEQFRGNANRLELNAQVRTTSERIITRREKALAEQKFYWNISAELPAYREILKKKKSIGDTEEETEEIFINNWTDSYVASMNMLMDYSERLNDFKEKQIKCAENLALSGLLVTEGYEHGGHLMFDIVETEEFFWDRSAKKPDLSDSEFMGRAYFALPTSIYERYQVSPEDAENIENYVRTMTGTTTVPLNSGLSSVQQMQGVGTPKVPVYNVFWKDIDRSEWGYVNTEFGIPALERINHIKDGEKEPKYTDKDVIDYPKTPKNEQIFKGKNKVQMYNDIIRYCTFIPSETLASMEVNESKKEKIADVVLDWGIYEYQEVQLNSPSNAKFPFKCYTWAYIDGEILSPVDDAISPQRLINRILSATEAQINMSGGSGTVFDMDTIDPQDAKTGKIHRDIKQGKPVYIRTKGRGVPNSIGTYDDTVKAGTYNMFGVINTLKEMVQSTTGVNEPLQGQSMGQDQLVGVTELLIQRGSLMQEPFYKAIENVYIQMYQMIATVGKKIYIDNQMNLVNAVGDDYAETITLSEDMLNEDFRVFVQRENSDDIQRKQGDILLNTLLQMQMIDLKMYSDHYGRSKYDEILRALRRYSAVQIEAQRTAEKQQQAQAQQASLEQDANLQLMQQEQMRQEQRQDFKDQEKMQHEANVSMDKELVKLMSKEQGQAGQNNVA